MHTFRASNGTVFNYNSDFSGAIHILRVETERNKAFIDGDDILEFVAVCYIKNKLISRIEDLEWRNMLYPVRDD